MVVTKYLKGLKILTTALNRFTYDMRKLSEFSQYRTQLLYYYYSIHFVRATIAVNV